MEYAQVFPFAADTLLCTLDLPHLILILSAESLLRNDICKIPKHSKYLFKGTDRELQEILKNGFTCFWLI